MRQQGGPFGETGTNSDSETAYGWPIPSRDVRLLPLKALESSTPICTDLLPILQAGMAGGAGSRELQACPERGRTSAGRDRVFQHLQARPLPPFAVEPASESL
jgi:hypothetical protein